MICKGYVEANNKFLKLHNANKRTSYMIYLDANNLYGDSMMKLLLNEILEWVDPREFNLDNYSRINLDIPIGCFTEVDLDYPDELHDLHNDYPLTGDKIKVRDDMFSKYQLQIIADNSSSSWQKQNTYP